MEWKPNPAQERAIRRLELALKACAETSVGISVMAGVPVAWDGDEGQPMDGGQGGIGLNPGKCVPVQHYGCQMDGGDW
ncbi:MAG: hypothetical protein GY937_23060 [bacterium]|nr:hypothetical protein [bacterium]